jgi:hypothetical protein
MSEADAARGKLRRRVADLADALVDDDVAGRGDRDAPRVVAAILQLLEAAQHDAAGVVTGAHVTKDSAHSCLLLAQPEGDAKSGAAARAMLAADQEGIGTLGGLCQRVTALVCSAHDDRARRGTIRRIVRSVPTSSSARRRTWR